MDNLERLLSSRVKAEVFRLLFGPDALELHGREIARRARLNDATVRQELQRLRSLQLVSLRRDGNRAYYRAEKAHPLYLDIRNLVLKTSGLVDVIRLALAKGKSAIRSAFVFGSLADGSEKSGSDVDLMVIGSISLRQLSALLTGLEMRLGREINPHVLTPAEFARRRKGKDHFLTTVLADKKMLVVGTADELEAMGR